MEKIYAVGRRKTSVARVHLKSGSGKVSVNGKELKDYFAIPHIYNKVLEPIQIIESSNAYDYFVNVNGGGIKGQAEAAKLAIARSLVKVDAEFKPALKAKKCLTCDSRVVERKKYGKPKARKSFQFSKR